jgi:O-antigen ligase
MLTASVLLVLAWGVLAFGAVYPWAYWPLVLVMTAIGGCGLIARSPIDEPRWAGLSGALAAVGVVVAIQLVPVPVGVLAFISPARDQLLRQHDVQYAIGMAVHPLSIAPTATRLGLACYVGFSVFCLGVSRHLSTRQTIHIVHGIVLLGVVVAVAGIIQRASGVDRIYGFWQPIHNPYQIFGPFVNRNHYAGWMIMTLSVTLGYVYGRIATGMVDVKPGWRDRLLWFSSPAANQMILAAISLPLMALALIWTLSRSGIACFLVALAVGVGVVSRRGSGKQLRTRRVIAVGYATAVVLILSGWTSLDAVVDRFAANPGVSLEGRLGAWRDGSRIIRDFPLVGTGLNTFGTAMVFYQSSGGGSQWDTAHNDYVQLAAEGGVLLVVPIAVALTAFARRVRRHLHADEAHPMAYWLRMGAVIGLLAIGIQEMVDFSLQLPGNTALFATLAAIAIRAPEPCSGRGQTRSKIAMLGR